MNVFHIVGARPNFIKVAPVMNALKTRKHVVQNLIHTGQHYDANMSDVFFEQLGIPAPNVNLAVGSGSPAWQTAEIMTRLEPVLLDGKPDVVLVYGDVNSTVAAALVGAKLGVRVGHVEAGLRSFDRAMPEEINRLVTDQLADMLFTPSEDGDINLQKEGIPAERIFRVGNVMIDSLVRLLPAAQRQNRNRLPERYALVTLHRPANVDDGEILKRILQSLLEVSQDLAVIFPAHPRTRKRIADFGLQADQLQILDPLSYLEFLGMQSCATVVITDSGGIQEVDHVPWRSLPDAPREHRAAGYGFPGNQRSCRTRSGKTVFRTLPSSGRQRKEGNHPSSLGRSRGRKNRRFARWLDDLLSYS